MKIGNIVYLDAQTAWNFLKNKHYAGRKPNISVAFGWLIEGELVAVCTFGKPASNFLCESICGEKFADSVYELNRLCRVDNLEYPLSMFVARCLNALKNKDWIIVSYSDTAMNHHGYIYQSLNFIYTGITKERLDPYVDDKKHARHLKFNGCEQRQVRSQKHRYIYFATNRKIQKKIWLENLRFEILPYPKGDNSNYKLGTFLKPKVIKIKNNESEENNDE
jgi:hypothetical protein